MRLHRVEIEGFGPFTDVQTVDFDAFADDGIFLIAGRTGAGKSSILDAICFGLYGGVPRYETGEKRLRSDHSGPGDESRVSVDFSTPAGRFRVTRSPEYLRPAKRGGTMTKQAATAALEEWTDGTWVGRAARAVDVAGLLDEILQLTQQQFLQVILLAQNRFARFLLADSRERQSLLRRLFGTERFEDIQTRFDERRKASEQSLGATIAAVTAFVEQAEVIAEEHGWWREEEAASEGSAAEEARTTAERLRALDDARARAVARSQDVEERRRAAEQAVTIGDAALAAIRAQHQEQQEREKARTTLAALDAEQPLIDAARAELDHARAAESLRAPLDALLRARESESAAIAQEQHARTLWDGIGEDIVPGDQDALRAWIARRTGETALWRRGAEQEAQQDARAAEHAEVQEAERAESARIEDIDAENAELPARIAALTAQRDATRRLADRLPDLAREEERAASRRDAAQESARLDDELRAEERRSAEAAEASAQAQTTLAALQRRRVDGMSGELAEGLAEGLACPVCGSLEHPLPAAHADPVSEEDVAHAQAVRDEAAQREREVAERVTALRSAHAAAAARSEGRTPDRAAEELRTAQQEHAAARDASAALPEQDDALTAAGERSAVLAASRREAVDALSAVRERGAALAQRRRDAEAEIHTARGDFATVSARLDVATAQLDAAASLLSALDERERSGVQRAEAERARDAAISASLFRNADTVGAALRTAAEQQALEQRLTDHAVRRRTASDALAALAARDIPAEPVDVDAAQRAAADAREIWRRAVDDAGAAETIVRQLSGLLSQALAAHEHGAAQAAAHETLQALADTLAGRGANTRRMALETFVLAAELEEIVAAANRRLADMSAGRYQLQHSDALAARRAASGLGIVVFDAFTGQTRPAQSLSGGETFLASLALALGMSEVVTSRAGGIRLDTLFIDEGFGSLDGDTLDVAMRTLDELRQGGRIVGVISHVEAMQEQIPAQIVVEQTASGPSRIRS